VWALCVCIGLTARAQDADLLPGDDLNHLVDRIDIQGLTGEALPTEYKPYAREQVARWLAKVDTTRLRKRGKQWLHRGRILADDYYVTQRGGKLAKVFYPNRRDFFGYTSEKFRVYANPVLNLGLGYELDNVSNRNGVFATNGRGVSLRGSLFRKVGFYTEFTDNQSTYPGWVRRMFLLTQSLPGEGYFKPLNSGFFRNGFDFFSVRGYVTYSPIKYLRFKFGRDRIHWGNGSQSLFVSDHAVDQLYFSLTLRIWKLDYLIHFGEFIDYIPSKPDAYGIYPRKYGAYHLLLFRPIKQLSIGIFESTMYATQLANGRRGLEWQYFNPLIFYRSVEAFIGSPDNSMLGLMFKANIWRRFQLHGQFLMDDFNFAELRRNRGWFGQKLGFQLGFKYIDMFGIETLDLAVETNRVSPYTYSHFNPSSAYTHYNQFLGHAAGANLQDVNVTLRYMPVNRLHLMLAYTWLTQGRDPRAAPNQQPFNYGWNPLLSDASRNNGQADPSFNNRHGQGQRFTLHAVNFRATYQIWNLNAWVDLDLWFRRENSQQHVAGQLSLRWALPHRQDRY
jgi:hypothetical protein